MLQICQCMILLCCSLCKSSPGKEITCRKLYIDMLKACHRVAKKLGSYFAHFVEKLHCYTGMIFNFCYKYIVPLEIT